MTTDSTILRFEVPDGRVASSPPEARGLERDAIGLMVASPQRWTDTVFRRLPDHLAPGDLVVVNDSPTMPAAIEGVLSHSPVVIHFSTPTDGGRWIVELRRPDGSGPILEAVAGESVSVPDGSVRLVDAVDGGPHGTTRLWSADVAVDGGVRGLLRRHGSPIRYGYVAQSWPMAMYQTVFADERRWPGSAEMPSAGRPFTRRMVAQLRRRGVELAQITLHAGVSSQEAHEPPQPERFEVTTRTAAQVDAARRRGARIVAVGTTVTRALESAAGSDGQVTAAAGWTDLVLGPDRPARVVNGLVTGWHPPEASHLDLLRAVAGDALVAEAYRRAVEGGYLWHEFGDSCLLLPPIG